MLRLFIHNFKIAYEAILQNKLRATLTSLGIICGVASVIAMLAIGKGAEQAILEKLKLLGTNNIIIKPIDKNDKNNQSEEEEEESQNTDATKKKKRFSPGLSMPDANSIKNIPHVSTVSPEIILETMALRKGFKRNLKLVGVEPEYFSTNLFEIASGKNFLERHLKLSEPVCIIGHGIKSKLFPTDNPIGKKMKCGKHWLKVIGVIRERNISRENIQNLGIRDYNYDVYIPISTMLIRYINRSLVTKQDLQRRGRRSQQIVESYHQLDRVIVVVDETSAMRSVAEILGRMLQRRHMNEIDYEIIVPELLLEQEQKTKSIFNIVLGAIASISLIVGGIGIMNIMLASVLERIKEIGIRRAVGAKEKDILFQFLSEAVSISLTGGFVGIILGFILSYIIEKTTDIHTIVSAISVLISFFVSISVGLIFGIMPARKAAKQDPIISLRYE